MTPVHDYPWLFSLWGNTQVDARYDLQAVNFTAGNSSAIAIAKAANPTLIVLATAGNINPIAPCHVTYGSLSYENFSSAVTDSLVDGAAGNAGTIRAFNDKWDHLYRADGTRAPIYIWNVANGPYARDGLTSTDSNIAKFILYRLKQGGLYAHNWDGYHSDNWAYEIDSGNFAGSNVDANRDGVADGTSGLRTNSDDGLDRIGTYLRDNLPGKIVGGNCILHKSPHLNTTWGAYGTDRNGWQKSTNWAMQENGHQYLYSDALAQNFIDACTSTDSSTNSTTGQSNLGYLNYPDPYGMPRYALLMFELHDDNQNTLATPSNYNSPSVYKQAQYYKPSRKGLAIALCAGTGYFPLFTQLHDSRLWYDDEYRGGTLNARGWMGQPISQPTSPQTNIKMREFQRGLAIGNVGSASQSVSVPGGSGTWRRISGDGSNAFNDGSQVGATVTVAGHDGVFLIRNGVAPPPTGSPPSVITLPAISGVMQETAVVVPSVGTWTDAPSSYSVEWDRYDASGAVYQAVAQTENIPATATPATYTLLPVDVDNTLRLRIAATNQYGTGAALSAPTPLIQSTGGSGTDPYDRFDGPPSAIFSFSILGTTYTFPPSAIWSFSNTPVAGAIVNTVLPAVTGATIVGQTLTCSTGTWTGPVTSYAYQWRRETGVGTGVYADISSATQSFYVLSSADLGRRVECAVTAT